jgi:hypothetical protein
LSQKNWYTYLWYSILVGVGRRVGTREGGEEGEGDEGRRNWIQK